jgi:hypothetical protein
MKINRIKSMLQKWNNAATQTQIEASNIFSFDALSECSEKILLIANKMKKFENNKAVLSKTEGKNNMNSK